MQAIRSQSTNKTFFFFHFARTALRQEKQRLFLHIALGLFFFFFSNLASLTFFAVSFA